MRLSAFAFGSLMLLAACGKEQPATVDPQVEENIRKYTASINAYKDEAKTSGTECRRMARIADDFLANFQRVDSSVTGANQNIAEASNQLGLAAGEFEEIARVTLPEDSNRKQLETTLRSYYTSLHDQLDRAGRRTHGASDYMYSAATYLDRSYGSVAQGVRQFQNEILVTSDRVARTVQNN